MHLVQMFTPSKKKRAPEPATQAGNSSERDTAAVHEMFDEQLAAAEARLAATKAREERFKRTQDQILRDMFVANEPKRALLEAIGQWRGNLPMELICVSRLSGRKYSDYRWLLYNGQWWEIAHTTDVNDASRAKRDASSISLEDRIVQSHLKQLPMELIFDELVKFCHEHKLDPPKFR